MSTAAEIAKKLGLTEEQVQGVIAFEQAPQGTLKEGCLLASLSHDELIVMDEFGPEVGSDVLSTMRPYSVACPESTCQAPLGTACLTAGGAPRDLPHSSRERLAQRRYGTI